MDFSVEEILVNALPELIKLIFGGFLATPSIVKISENISEKNRYEKTRYIKFLTENFPLIKSFLATVKDYKNKTSLKGIHPLSIFYLGITGGILIEMLIATIIGDILGAILNIDYIAKLLYPTLNAENLEMLRLNVAILYSSCLNISFSIIFLFGVWWIRSNKSRSLLTPLLTKTGKISSSAYLVYLSYWGFIGITIGANILAYLVLYGSLLKCSVIREYISFDLVHFNNLYITLKTNLIYPFFYSVAHVFGIMLSLVLILGMYQRSKDFSNSVIKSVTYYYNCNFPYLKIKTGNGEIEGQLIDMVQNKSLVTLRDKIH